MTESTSSMAPASSTTNVTVHDDATQTAAGTSRVVTFHTGKDTSTKHIGVGRDITDSVQTSTRGRYDSGDSYYKTWQKPPRNTYGIEKVTEKYVPTLTGKTDAAATTGSLALAYMMQYRRPHRSRMEEKFIQRWLKPLGLDEDAFGNLWCKVGQSRVMWSCHTDTVHHKSGVQRVALINNQFLGLGVKEKDSSCLGADDTAGIWIMREMILKQVPGLYVFHRGEEVGGLGSKWLTKNNPKLVEDIDYAIALDRKGYTSVITHQCGRCCSDEFAEALGTGVGDGYKPDTTGLYTDTAEYTDLVAECTNLSVGYFGAHTESEILDVHHAIKLRDALCALDTTKLPVKRDPTKPSYQGYGSDYGEWWSHRSGHPQVDNGTRRSARDSYETFKSAGVLDDIGDLDFEDDFDTFAYLCKNYPDETADWLETLGLNSKDLVTHILQAIT